MSKRISDLNQAKADRAKNTAQLPDPQRPRLAERLVALAPLARAASPIESESAPAEAELSRLSDAPRFQRRVATESAAPSANALVPRRHVPVPRAQEPVRLSRVSEVPPIDIALDDDGSPRSAKAVAGFLLGLAIAGATGFALYALLA